MKNLPAKEGDARDVSLIPGLGNFLELEMATYSSILTCKMQGQRSPESYSLLESQGFRHDLATEHNLVNVINIDDILSRVAEACELLGHLWQQCLSLWF